MLFISSKYLAEVFLTTIQMLLRGIGGKVSATVAKYVVADPNSLSTASSYCSKVIKNASLMTAFLSACGYFSYTALQARAVDLYSFFSAASPTERTLMCFSLIIMGNQLIAPIRFFFHTIIILIHSQEIATYFGGWKNICSALFG